MSLSYSLAKWLREQRVKAWHSRARKARARGETLLAEWCEEEGRRVEHGLPPLLEKVR